MTDLSRYADLVRLLRNSDPFESPALVKEILPLAAESIECMSSNLQTAEDNYQSILDVFRMLLPMVPDSVKPCIEDILKEG